MEDPLRAGARDPDLRLIETMLWDGTCVPRLAAHQARLQASAARLGWPCPLLAPEGAAHPARLRVTLAASGALEQTAAPLPAPIALWRVGLARTRLASDDPWLTIKSTRRAAYDQARAHLPEGLEELIFLNERDEVCDGTITTVFFDRGAGLRTPPLTSGLLPGVLRAEIAAPEEVLHARDLPHVALYIGNALRGLSPAIFIPQERPL